MTTTTLDTLSAADRDGFVARLADIFEHSPWIPERAWAARPFASVDALHAAMLAVLDAASDEEKLGLIRAHPELAGKAAVRGELTRESTREQAGAGLAACTQEEFELIQALNAAYNARFGFPFIIAVRGLARADIIAAMQRRLDNPDEVEFAEALAQIARIAALRLEERVAP